MLSAYSYPKVWHLSFERQHSIHGKKKQMKLALNGTLHYDSHVNSRKSGQFRDWNVFGGFYRSGDGSVGNQPWLISVRPRTRPETDFVPIFRSRVVWPGHPLFRILISLGSPEISAPRINSTLEEYCNKFLCILWFSVLRVTLTDTEG
jgi:hypothetical protein